MELMEEALGLRFSPPGVVAGFLTVVFAFAGVVEGKPIRVTLCTGAKRPYLGWQWKYLMIHKSIHVTLLIFFLDNAPLLNVRTGHSTWFQPQHHRSSPRAHPAQLHTTHPWQNQFHLRNALHPLSSQQPKISEGKNKVISSLQK